MTAPDFRDEAAAALEARKELGPDYEHAVLESFVNRAAESIDQRVDARLAEYGVGRTPQEQQTGNPHLALAITSLSLGVVASIPLGIVVGLPMVLVVWTGIAVVNVAYALRQKPPQKP